MVLVMDIKDMDIQLAHILNETYIVRVYANPLSDFFRFVEHNFMILEGICSLLAKILILNKCRIKTLKQNQNSNSNRSYLQPLMLLVLL